MSSAQCHDLLTLICDDNHYALLCTFEHHMINIIFSFFHAFWTTELCKFMFSVFSAVKVNQMKPTMQGTLLATILVLAHVPKYVLLFIFNPVVQNDNKRMYPRTRLQESHDIVMDY